MSRASQGTLISESQQEPKLGERMVSGMFEARDEEKTCIVKSALAVTLVFYSEINILLSPCPFIIIVIVDLFEIVLMSLVLPPAKGDRRGRALM